MFIGPHSLYIIDLIDLLDSSKSKPIFVLYNGTYPEHGHDNATAHEVLLCGHVLLFLGNINGALLRKLGS